MKTKKMYKAKHWFIELEHLDSISIKDSDGNLVQSFFLQDGKLKPYSSNLWWIFRQYSKERILFEINNFYDYKKRE